MGAKDMVTIPREVLEKLQWAGVTGYKECAFCDGDPIVGHKEDCPIGIALKKPDPKPEAPATVPVQHEMEFDGEKYVTECTDLTGFDCEHCDVQKACDKRSLPDVSVMCMAYKNPDRKNRLWKKVTK